MLNSLIIFVEFDFSTIDLSYFQHKSKQDTNIFSVSIFGGQWTFVTSEYRVEFYAPVYEFLREFCDVLSFVANSNYKELSVVTSDSKEKKLNVMMRGDFFLLIFKNGCKISISKYEMNKIIHNLIAFIENQGEFYFPFLNFDFKYLEYKDRLNKLVSTIVA